MNALELADALEIRAKIRRQATSRKSVQEGANDRLADQLEQAAFVIRKQVKEIQLFKKVIQSLCDDTQQAEIEYFEDEPQCEELFEILKDAQTSKM